MQTQLQQGSRLTHARTLRISARCRCRCSPHPILRPSCPALPSLPAPGQKRRCPNTQPSRRQQQLLKSQKASRLIWSRDGAGVEQKMGPPVPVPLCTRCCAQAIGVDLRGGDSRTDLLALSAETETRKGRGPLLMDGGILPADAGCRWDCCPLTSSDCHISTTVCTPSSLHTAAEQHLHWEAALALPAHSTLDVGKR